MDENMTSQSDFSRSIPDTPRRICKLKVSAFMIRRLYRGPVRVKSFWTLSNVSVGTKALINGTCLHWRKDATARRQLIRREINLGYCDIVDEYAKLSGIPRLINAGFNTHEEPIAVIDDVVEVTDGHLGDNRSARRAAAAPPYRCVPATDCRPYQFLSLVSQLPELQVDKPMSAGV